MRETHTRGIYIHTAVYVYIIIYMLKYIYQCIIQTDALSHVLTASAGKKISSVVFIYDCLSDDDISTINSGLPIRK